MALLQEQFTETLNAGAPDITYEGEEGREQQVAQALWDKLPPQVRMQFGSFQQFFSSGAWKKVLEMLQQQMQGQQGPQEEIQETETIQTQPQPQPQQGIASMMPAQMANGGDVRLASASDPMDEKNQISYSLFGKPLHELNPEEEMMLDDWLEDKAQKWGGAYGGIAGADGRRAYGIGSWFQKKIMDPIKGTVKKVTSNPLGLAALGAGLGTLANYKDIIPGQMDSTGWFGKMMKSAPVQGAKNILIGGGDGKSSGDRGILGSLLTNPNFLIPAAGLVAGTFAKPDDPGYTGQGTGLNLRDVGRIANITDPKTAMASGLRFSPDVETRKFTPAEMLQSYAATDAKDFSTPAAAYGGRIRAQEGGLMDLGGMEKDYRNDGGFVPIGGEEKADDVPARLSRNEFVFTADAVRNAGGGDIDKGAEVMENVMKNLEGGGRISDESQGKGAGEMFEVSERLSEVV